MFNKFWKNKRVLITGHTGFMGSWLCLALSIFGAKIIGISLKPKTNPNLFSILNLKKKIFKNFIFDIKNKKRIETIIKKYKPEVVYHLAAEALVRKSYLNPEKTYHTNIIGTVNIFEALTNSILNKNHLSFNFIFKNKTAKMVIILTKFIII